MKENRIDLNKIVGLINGLEANIDYSKLKPLTTKEIKADFEEMYENLPEDEKRAIDDWIGFHKLPESEKKLIEIENFMKSQRNDNNALAWYMSQLEKRIETLEKNQTKKIIRIQLKDR